MYVSSSQVNIELIEIYHNFLVLFEVLTEKIFLFHVL